MRIKATVCKVFDLDDIPMRDASPLCFRVEILRQHESGTFDAVFYRLEMFRVAPRFVEDEFGNQMIADHQFFVVDDYWERFSFVSSTEEDTVKLVEAKVSEIFAAAWERDSDPE